MRAWYIREQRHILGTSDYAEVDLFETTDKEHTASTRRKRELATSIAQQKYNDMIARRYFCQLAYTNFGESDWAVTFTYDHGHQPAPGDFDQVDRDWTNFTRRLKRFCKKMGREASKWIPDNMVLMIPSNANFMRAYGLCNYLDDGGNWHSFEGDRLLRTYVEHRPDRRFIELQSHPLLIPDKVDSWLVAEVC